MNVGIPEFRLPNELVQAEIDLVKGLGVEIKPISLWEKDIDFNDLKEEGWRRLHWKRCRLPDS